jgi:hypothetical protein
MSYNISDALNILTPDAKWVVHNDTIVEWNSSDIAQPTEKEINTKIAELEAEWIAQKYARDRKAEYDALNQLEMQYDDKAIGTTTWEDAIVAIKTKYPKV